MINGKAHRLEGGSLTIKKAGHVAQNVPLGLDDFYLIKLATIEMIAAEIICAKQSLKKSIKNSFLFISASSLSATT